VLALALLGSLPAANRHAANLQSTLDRAMAGRAGAAVAIDAASGRILASYHIKVAAQRLASPGSTVKPFTLLALLQSNARPPLLICRRSVRIAGRELDCTHPESSGPLDAVAALAYSCNFYFAMLARGLHSSDLTATFTRAGLVSATGLYASEAAGEITPPASVEARELLALGEANILVTPLALLAAYRRLALDPKLPAEIRAGLEAAASYGTARLAQPGIRVAGKTGTSLDAASGQAHAWFVGFAPAGSGPEGAPRIVLVVFLEQGTGGRDAAPVAAELFRAALPAP
jgi:cell division protein FtsI/penicillin-binding protein 2